MVYPHSLPKTLEHKYLKDDQILMWEAFNYTPPHSTPTPNQTAT